MEDLREQRGIVLAATKQIHQHGDCWIVPSQSGKGVYAVRGLAETNPECSCPDYEARRQNCKHIYAAIFVSRREHNADGSTTVTETIALTRQRTTYPQAWPAYNAAQTNEKDKFLCAACSTCAVESKSRNSRSGTPQVAVVGCHIQRRVQGLFDRQRTPLHERSAGRPSKGLHRFHAALQFDFQLP